MSIGYEGLGMRMHIGGKRLLDSDNFLLLSCTVLSMYTRVWLWGVLSMCTRVRGGYLCIPENGDLCISKYGEWFLCLPENGE